MPDDRLSLEPATQAGLAHVATASFLASRVVPTGGYAVALAGGVALARASLVAGLRTGYGASIAAMLEAMAVLGPSRVSVPLTQALSAPLLGRMHARGTRLSAQVGACAAIRASDQLLFTLFYIVIIAGGVEAYAATYDALAGRIPGVPDGTFAALAATAIVLIAWTVFASVVQVLVYRAALRAWPAEVPDMGSGRGARGVGAVRSGPGRDVGGDRAAGAARSGSGDGGRGERAAGAAPSAASGDVANAPAPPPRPRYDPRAVALASGVAFCVLIASTAWIVLGAVAVWLAIAWATARADRAPVRAGLALAALLGGGALLFGLIGGSGLEVTLQRTVRASLLVLVATWLRAAAGEHGLREVARRSLGRLRRVPAVDEAAEILDRLGASGALGASARTLVARVRHVPRRPSALAVAVLGWVASEAARFDAPPPEPAPGRLRTAWRDRALVATVIATVAGAVLAG